MAASPRVAVVHADWLSLVDPHGPFLTLPVLRAAWPNGLDRTLSGPRGELRTRVDELGAGDAERRAFTEWVLRRLLGYGPYLRFGQAIPDVYTVTLPEHGETLRPDWIVAADTNGSTGTARLLVSFWPAGTDFAAHIPGSRWTASPSDRMVALCRATGVELGIVTDGSRYQLVWAPPGAVGRATWSATVFAEAAERTLFDSFTSVLGARRLFSVAADQTLERLLAASADAHAEVTTTLGRQVRQAVELLVGAFSRGHPEHGGNLLTGIDPQTVYEAAATVMMRLVFLLYAEERHLLPLGEDLYDSAYAVSTLRQSLRDVADELGDEQALEYRHSAWPRLLSTFRAVWGGLAHDELRLPGYGGRLFDPDRYPFLEGRRPGESWRDQSGEPLPVDDRTVLAILAALQILQIREGGVTEPRRLSFRSLDVEQIGHVYEGLLDHGARRVDETTVGLIGKPGYEPEVALSELTRASAVDDRLGAWRLGAWIAEKTGVTPKKVAALLDKPLDDTRSRLLLAACEGDQALAVRLARFGWLIRDDLRGLPMVIPAGAIYVTEVSQRRDSGTEYTTRELAEEVVRHALEPLVYSPGPGDGAEPEDWKPLSSEEILALRVCDPAVGSGAILTAACRYLAERLVAAWTVEDSLPVVTGTSEEDDVDDVIIEARRAVAERCLYGVDRDPMAVEMAKLSLWLVTMAKDQPFSFLDHALQSGDSLLGLTALDQVAQFHMDPAAGRKRRSGRLFDYVETLQPLVERAAELRRRIEATPVHEVRDSEEKHRLLGEATAALDAVRIVADLVVGAAISTARAGKADLDYRLDAIGPEVAAALAPDVDDATRAERLAALDAKAQTWLNAGRPASAPIRRPLHWPVVFPEIFANGSTGWDAMMANPPYMGNKYWKERLGPEVQRYFEPLLGRKLGKPDLVVLFIWRMRQLIRGGGVIASLATQSLTEVDSKSLLQSAVLSQTKLFRAISFRHWPGSATVTFCALWGTSGEWPASPILDGQAVGGIGADLRPVRGGTGPQQLARTAFSFQGVDNSKGLALVVDPTHPLVKQYPDYFKPYVSGDDLTGDFSAPSRYVLDLTGWELERLPTLPTDVRAFVEDVVRPTRTKEALSSYQGLEKRWWTFWNTRENGFREVREFDSCFVMPSVSKYLFALELPSEWVYTNMVIVVSRTAGWLQELFLSSVFSAWVESNGGTMGERYRLKVSSVVETFPLPTDPDASPLAASWQESVARTVPQMEGVTEVLNGMHDPRLDSSWALELRGLVSDIDQAVNSWYGWSIDLDHAFHETSRGIRWTISKAARSAILERLLELNQTRYAEEIRLGLHDKKKAGTSKRKAQPSARTSSQLSLSGDTPITEDA